MLLAPFTTIGPFTQETTLGIVPSLILGKVTVNVVFTFGQNSVAPSGEILGIT
jgi:hypothetical protein